MTGSHTVAFIHKVEMRVNLDDVDRTVGLAILCVGLDARDIDGVIPANDNWKSA